MDWKQLEKDRETGTPGPWRSGVPDFYPGLDGPLPVLVYTAEAVEEAIVSGAGRAAGRANARRLARVPDLEALALAGRELAEALSVLDASGSSNPLWDDGEPVTAYLTVGDFRRATAALARWKEAGGEDE